MQVVSQVANATGEVVLLPDLNGVQGVAFERPTVVLAQVRGTLQQGRTCGSARSPKIWHLVHFDVALGLLFVVVPGGTVAVQGCSPSASAVADSCTATEAQWHTAHPAYMHSNRIQLVWGPSCMVRNISSV